MADAEDERSLYVVELQNHYATLQREELEVINAELDSIKKQSRIYVKKGGNLFFLDSNRQKTISEYKRLLDVKRKEIKKVEEAIAEKSSR